MSMRELTYQVSFNTPAFLGNAEQQDQWRTPPFKPMLRQSWRRVRAADASTGRGLVFTELTRMECRVKPLQTDNQIQLAAYDRVFSTPGYRFEKLTREVFDVATELRAQYGLKAPDAIHLAAALSSGCDEVWTNDDRLAKAAAGRIGVFNVKERNVTNT